MNLNKKQKEEFDNYVVELGKSLKNTILWESTDKYLQLQVKYKYDSFLVNYIERYMNIPYEDICEDNNLKIRFEKKLIPILKEMREELKIEHDEKIREERKRVKEELDKKGHRRKKK